MHEADGPGGIAGKDSSRLTSMPTILTKTCLPESRQNLGKERMPECEHVIAILIPCRACLFWVAFCPGGVAGDDTSVPGEQVLILSAGSNGQQVCAPLAIDFCTL